jgi:hypothetical protein
MNLAFAVNYTGDCGDTDGDRETGDSIHDF